MYYINIMSSKYTGGIGYDVSTIRNNNESDVKKYPQMNQMEILSLHNTHSFHNLEEYKTHSNIGESKTKIELHLSNIQPFIVVPKSSCVAWKNILEQKKNAKEQEYFKDVTYFENDVKYVDINKFDKKYINHKQLQLENYHLFKENTEDLECSICYDLFEHPNILPCKHTFCYKCLTKIIDNRCPLCRKKYDVFDKYNYDFETEFKIQNLTLTNCQYCNTTHSLSKSCTIYCTICYVDRIDETKYNHIYNECCGDGLIKYCFTCHHHVIKKEYDEHKKVCYNQYFHINFLQLKLYDSKDIKDIIIDQKILFEKVKHLLNGHGYPKIYFLHYKISSINLRIIKKIQKNAYKNIYNYRLKLVNKSHERRYDGGLRWGEMEPMPPTYPRYEIIKLTLGKKTDRYTKY